jgi:hypothetical protein
MAADMTEYDRRVAALSEERRALLARLGKRSAPTVPAPGRRPAHLVRAPLSPSQELLWLVNQKLPYGDPLRNITIAARMDGLLDAEALRYALDQLVARNESLRTVFGSIDGIPYQTVTEAVPAALVVDDLSSLPEDEREPAAWKLVNEAELHGAFDLTTGPLFRARLIKLSANSHVLSVSVHHTVCDGSGVSLICSKLAHLYEARIDGRSPSLPATLGQADFAWWQREHYLPSAEMAHHLDYWREHLRGAEPAILPSDRPRPAEPTYRGTYYRQRCAEDMRELLQALAQPVAASPLMVLVAAFAAVIAQLSGREDFVFATDTPGRDHADFQNVIGMFVNVLFLRMDTSGDPTFTQLIQRARNVLLDAWSHQAAPGPVVVGSVYPDAPRETNPLSTMTLQYLEQTTGVPGLTLSGLDATHLDLVLHRSRRDVSITLIDLGARIEYWIEYSTDLFDEERIRDVVERMDRAIRMSAVQPDIRISQLA